jgi:hypothetical protein
MYFLLSKVPESKCPASGSGGLSVESCEAAPDKLQQPPNPERLACGSPNRSVHPTPREAAPFSGNQAFSSSDTAGRLSKIIELLREVRVIAIRRIERLNLRINKLENQARPSALAPTQNPSVKQPAATLPSGPKRPEIEISNVLCEQ